MEKKITLCFLALIIVLSTYGQQADVSTVIPTSAPAFTVLGISPTEISKPSSWSKLQASLYQNLSSREASVPKNFALEFKPYWLSDHKEFTYRQYLNANGFSLRNLSISLASAQAPYSKDTVQSMGFGFRLPIMTGHKKRTSTNTQLVKKLNDARAKFEWQAGFSLHIVSFTGNTVGDYLADVKDKLLSPPSGEAFWAEHKSSIEALLADTLKSILEPLRGSPYDLAKQELIKNVVASYIDNRNRELVQQATEDISTALRNAPNLQLSGAFGLAFPSKQFTYSKFSQAAIWADYTTKFGNDSPIDGTGGLRYVRTFESDSASASSNFDLIYKLNFTLGAQEKFIISAWGVLRNKSNDLPSIVIDGVTYRSSKNLWDNKYGLDIFYKLSNDVALSYSFGKDYKNPSGITKKGGNQLISFLNLFYSLNSKLKKSGSDDYMIR